MTPTDVTDARDKADELRDYIDDRYEELNNDEINGHQLVTLTRGAIKKALANARAEGRAAGIWEAYRLAVALDNEHDIRQNILALLDGPQGDDKP